MSRHPFAPGVITRHKRMAALAATPAQRRELVRWLKLSLLCFVCTGALAFLAGLVSGWVS